MEKLKKGRQENDEKFPVLFPFGRLCHVDENMARPTKAGHSEKHEEMRGSFKRPVGPETLP